MNTYKRRRAIWAAIGCGVLLTAAQGQTWSVLGPGLEVFQGSFEGHGQRITFVLLRVDPKKNQLRVIDTFHEIGKGNSLAAFSIRDVMRKTAASVVVNAGSTASYSLPAPVGFLQIKGKVISRPNYKAEQGGIVCIVRDQVSIKPLLSTRPPRCVDAVQRGPLLTSDYTASGQKYRRSLAAVDSDGRLLILVTREKAMLSEVASFLYTSSLNLKIRSALNLDGDVSSGLMIGSAATSAPIEVGNVDSLVASAIAVYKKK